MTERENLSAGPFAGSAMGMSLRQIEGLSSQGLWSVTLDRLRARRSSRYCLRFLLLFALLSLATPLLPLPSPVALSLLDGARPPELPWEVFGRDAFVQEYWDLGPIDRWLVGLRESLFTKWQTGSWLGTDAQGRDLLSRILWGSRVSLGVGLAAAATSLVIGVSWGALAALVGGRVERWMMRIVDVLFSLPFVFVVIFVLGVLDTPRRDLNTEAWVDRERVLFVLIGSVTWLTMSRVVRGQVLSLKRADYVLAARAQGASPTFILREHVLPNVLPLVVVYLTLTIPAVMLTEAFLSFLGLGIEPPKVSWGGLAVDGIEAISPLRSSWWILTFPALAMGLTLLALNLLGDALRDALDPRAEGSAR